MTNSSPKVISMVPSWTETLIRCGIPVVGRTRFCIHPQQQVQDIPVVGGTKNISWDKVYDLKVDYLLLDKEENPKEMADESEIPIITTHVQSISDMAPHLRVLAKQLSNSKLNDLADRWQKVDECPNLPIVSLETLPGIKEWVLKPRKEVQKMLYLIWKDPYMAVSRDTFIGSVLIKLGLGIYIEQYDVKYPKIELSDYSKDSTLLLCATEPYPFHLKKKELEELKFPSVILDGECYSWFGIRTLEFLESAFSLQPIPELSSSS